MKKESRTGLRTWIEIDKGAIRHNFGVFRHLIPSKVKLLGVVKSNAYGHNLVEFGQELEKLGVDYLAVDSAVEGMALRREGIKIPILVLGYTLPEMILKAVDNDLDITVSNFNYFKEFKKIKTNKPIQVHIKADTGMHRHGFELSDLDKVLREIKDLQKTGEIQVVGLYTHFAMAKNPAKITETKKQIEIFDKWREAFAEADLKPICHACATAGTILFPEAYFDMVRAGIGLYGLWPAKETQTFARNKLKLRPVLGWKTVIGEIKRVKKGEKIGYDFTEKIKKDSIVAVCPVGYWHGLPRALSSIGYVLIGGKRCKVLGRVCMDIIMVDATDAGKIKVGDEVGIIGPGASLDDMAVLLDMSAYELVTRINPLIKRIYLDK